MNKLKIFIALSAIFCMLSVSAYALENLDSSLTAEVHILYDNEYYETSLLI